MTVSRKTTKIVRYARYLAKARANVVRYVAKLRALKTKKV